ncbi:MAG: hypothetical protein UT24_C0016G0068, partial [Candidatus Woesebacteria bacterium GW2011_GWB1_39_12]
MNFRTQKWKTVESATAREFGYFIELAKDL